MKNSAVLNCIKHNWAFQGLSIVSVLLLIASFIIPPQGVIDPSVLAAVGEIFAFSALGVVIKAIDKGKTAEITHGNTTIAIRKNEEELDVN